MWHQVVHALTSLFEPRKRKGTRRRAVERIAVNLSVETALESMIGCQVEYESKEHGKGKGKLLGYKAAGVRYGDTSGGLTTDGHCRVMFDVGHPSTGGSGEWNLAMAGVKVLSPRQVDTSKYKTVLQDNGKACREFELGALVKKEPPEVDAHWHAIQRGFVGGRRANRRQRGANRDGEDAGRAVGEDVPANEVFEVVKIGIDREIFDLCRREGLIFYDHPHDGSETVPEDFLVVKPIAADAEAFEDLDTLKAKLENPDPELVDEETRRDELLAKWGVFCVHDMAVAVSNSPQEIGDMFVAMSALRERAGLDEADEAEGDVAEAASSQLDQGTSDADLSEAAGREEQSD